MTKIVRNRINNSSDQESVLNAGWSAMQTADPRLAAAVSQMPPQVAQRVVLQYTNSIRLGKESEASASAAQAARDALAAFAQPAGNQNPSGVRKPFASKAPAYGVSDLASFDKAIAPPQQGTQLGQNFWKSSQEAQQKAQQQAGAEAFAGVKAADAKFQGPQEVIFPGDLPAQKDLTVPTNWSLPKPPEIQNQIPNQY